LWLSLLSALAQLRAQANGGREVTSGRAIARSRSSAGWSAQLITMRSAFQGRVGPHPAFSQQIRQGSSIPQACVTRTERCSRWRLPAFVVALEVKRGGFVAVRLAACSVAQGCGGEAWRVRGRRAASVAILAQGMLLARGYPSGSCSQPGLSRAQQHGALRPPLRSPRQRLPWHTMDGERPRSGHARWAKAGRLRGQRATRGRGRQRKGSGRAEWAA
jgi:hypothetical protein